MNGRRLLGMALFCLSAAAQGELRDYEFNVFLDGSEIGSHRFSFQSLGTEPSHYRLTSEASYRVKVLFVTVYEYRHRSVEEWRDGCLVEIRSATEDNGDEYRVSGERSGDGFRLRVNGETETVEENCIRTFAYWNPELIHTGQLLNSQTGELTRVEHEDIGTTPLPWQRDRRAATRKLATGDGPIELWYSGSGRWLGLRSPLKNGRVLHYRPVADDVVAAGAAVGGWRL